MGGESEKQEGGLRTRGTIKHGNPGEPLVSVITVVFNGEKYLEQSIESVLAQRYANLEYLVIDGGSTDRTLEIVRKYEDRIDYWVSERDRGIYEAMNKGIDLARGQWIAFLNSDDYYEAGAIESVVRGAPASPAITYGHTYVVMEGMNLRYKVYANEGYSRGMGVFHPAMFVHADVYRRIGNYDLKYRIAADFDFLIRAIEAGVRLVPTNQFLVNYRMSGMSDINLPRTLRENRDILAAHTGRWSRQSLVYSILYYKSSFLILLQSFLRERIGDAALNAARAWYLKTVFAHEREPLKTGQRR